MNQPLLLVLLLLAVIASIAFMGWAWFKKPSPSGRTTWVVALVTLVAFTMAFTFACGGGIGAMLCNAALAAFALVLGTLRQTAWDTSIWRKR